MIGGRLAVRLTLALVLLGSVALAASIGATAWLIGRADREQAIALAELEADEILDKARSGRTDIEQDVASVVRRRLGMSEAARVGCSGAARDPRLFLIRAAGQRDETSAGLNWGQLPPDRSSVRLTVPARIACLSSTRPAWGAVRSFPGGRFAVARMIDEDPRLWRRAAAIGTGVFVLFAGLAAAVGALFNAALMARIRSLNAVLDRVEDSGFAVRADRAGLGQELGELADHLNAMIARMGDLTGNLSRLSIHIAHDLRSPLDALRRKLARLGEQLGQPDSVATLEDARAQVDALLRRCLQLLDIVRIETSTRDTFAPVDLRAQLQLLIEDVFEDEAAERGVAIAFDAARPVEVLGLVDILQRLFANLLQNAVKFAAPATTIRVALTAEGGQVRVTIDNDGPQVPNERLDTIFEPDVAAPVTSGGGYGLGLPFVRAAARRHGGDAVAEPLPDGMRIAVRLGVGR